MSSIVAADQLSWFEVPRAFVEPSVRFLRLANTVLDVAFYDVNMLLSELQSHGLSVIADPEDEEILRGCDMAHALRTLDLDALSNPEGSILVVSAKGPSYVTPFDVLGETACTGCARSHRTKHREHRPQAHEDRAGS